MDIDGVQDKELVRELARIRESAGLTQSELARRLGVSQTVVSRTESGERRLDSADIQRFAEAIGPEEARRLQTRASREWSELTRPALGHPDHDLLWAAEIALRDLRTLLALPDITQAFARRVEALADEIGNAANELQKRECNLVFVGKVGVGKTSAICHAANLTVSKPGSPRPSPVLDVGAGRTTLCEVHIRTGATGIVIEPCTASELRAHVADFADKILEGVGRGGEKSATPDDQILSREVERAIRNMAELRRPSPRRTENALPPDPAKELADQVMSEERGRGNGEQDIALRLQFEILSRMRVDQRQRSDLTWDESLGPDRLEWIRSEFHRINTGNHREFTIPKRIHVLVDRPLIPGVGEVDVSIVDTKGIDETVARADLEKHIGASHTVLVLCSGFNEAPGTEATNLLRRASDAGLEESKLQGVVLGLPKFDEALQMLDDAGEPVDSIDEGYSLKTGVVEDTVHQSLGFRNFSIKFFNSHEDDAADIRDGLGERIGMVFDGFRNAVTELVDSAKDLVENYEDEQAQEVVMQAATLVRSWIAQHKDLHSLEREAEHSLLGEVGRAHPATIHATMRRNGGWYNLDYSHHLAYGARLVVSSVLRDRIRSFGDLCDTFLGVEEHHHAKALLSQSRRTLEKASQTASERAHLLGEMWFHNELRRRDKFWRAGMRRWGEGAGYVEDILNMNNAWFAKNGELNDKVRSLVRSEWQHAMQEVRGMLEES